MATDPMKWKQILETTDAITPVEAQPKITSPDDEVQMHAAYQASKPTMLKKQTTEPSSMATETSNNNTENLKPEVTQRQKLSIISLYC